LRNSIRDVFPFILAPISFTQKLPATCVYLLTDTLSETGELEKAIVSSESRHPIPLTKHLLR